MNKEILQINWTEKNEDIDKSLDNLLDFLIHTRPKFIILNYDTFEYSVMDNSINSTLNELKKSNPKDVLKSFLSLNGLLKTKDCQIYFFELSFVDNGFCFTYQEYAEWSTEFSEFNEIQDEFNRLELLSDRYLINRDTLKITKELSNFELFIKAKNKAQRELAASIFFKDRLLSKRILYNISSIIEYADSISKMDIKEYIE